MTEMPDRRTAKDSLVWQRKSVRLMTEVPDRRTVKDSPGEKTII